MPRLLQIDSCLGILSTGRIAEEIAQMAQSQGWECFMAHGARYIGKTIQQNFQIESKRGEYLHYVKSLLFDAHGLGSERATRGLINYIKEIKPDVIQLHCIHGYYLNYKILFEYINANTIPVVWTFHDCWAFTGHCSHFMPANCYKWRDGGCSNCPQTRSYPKSLIDRSSHNFELKRRLFLASKNLHIVTVSDWLKSLTKQSFFKDKDIRVINNGVDVYKFSPKAPKSKSKYKIIGVASAWGTGKGLYEFYKVRERLPKEKYEIILVGLSSRQISDLPQGIIGISRTNSQEELASLYSQANVLLNPTFSDSFPTVNMEALACGTQVITYQTGGSPEIVDEKTGIIVKQGDIDGLIAAIKRLQKTPFLSEDCRNRAVNRYDKDKRFADYINLYESLIKK